MSDRRHRLDGKVAVVTGASRGLGSSIGAALAAEGARVALLGRTGDALAAVAARIGPAAQAVPADVGDPVSVADAFAQVAGRHGRVDVLVNNAAVGEPTALEELSDEQIQRQTATNFLGPIYCIRSALPLLRAAGGGDVINVSSVAVLNPYPMMWLYSATKAALELASTGLAEELRADGVRVTVLRCGSIDATGFQDTWTDADRDRAFELAQSAGRERFAGAEPVAPELIADWVVSIATLAAGARVGVLELRPR